MAVKLFKNRSAELGDPNKSLLFAKLESPPFCGARRKMIKIKNPLNSNQSIFNIIRIIGFNKNNIKSLDY